MKKLVTPLSDKVINELSIGDMIEISGSIFTGRDAVLPQLAELYRQKQIETTGIELSGGIIFHTAVSPAGTGPTSSNKIEIEDSIPFLAKAGIKIHIGKGALKQKTIDELNAHNSIYAVVPPVTALLSSKILKTSVLAFPEEGMEAMHILDVKNFPAIIAAAHGKSIYQDL